MMNEVFKLQEEYIRLDDLLKLTGCVQTGGQAKVLIQGGEVHLGGEVCTMRGKKLRGGEVISIPADDVVITVEG